MSPPADSATAPLSIAVIGAGGRIAQDWLAVLEEDPGLCRVTALVEREADARARLAAGRDVAVFDDVTALLAGPPPDAALVATPPSTHEPLALELLAAGCHVLCEKPLATSDRAAERMLAAAERHGRHLMMASKFRFVEDVAAAAELLAGGVVGAPLFYDNVFASWTAMADRWNADPELSGGGVLIDHGAHAVDLARCLVGDIARVAAAVGPRVQDLPVEDSVRLLFETGSGAPVLGRIDLSWSMAPDGGSGYATVHGTEGTLVLDWTGGRFRRHGEDWQTFGKGYAKRGAFLRQLRHFAAVVRGRQPLLITPEDALESVRFVTAAYAAAESRRWIELPSRGRSS